MGQLNETGSLQAAGSLFHASSMRKCGVTAASDGEEKAYPSTLPPTHRLSRSLLED